MFKYFFIACCLCFAQGLHGAPTDTVGALPSRPLAWTPSDSVEIIQRLSQVDLSEHLGLSKHKKHLGKKDPVIAWLLNFVLGPIGLHRLYLGTKPINILWYILSVGGICGLIPMIDWVMLLIGMLNDNDISKYENNPHFLMWLK